MQNLTSYKFVDKLINKLYKAFILNINSDNIIRIFHNIFIYVSSDNYISLLL